MATSLISSSQPTSTEAIKKRKHKDETKEARKKRRHEAKTAVQSRPAQIVESEPLKQLEQLEETKKQDLLSNGSEHGVITGNGSASQDKTSADRSEPTASKRKKHKASIQEDTLHDSTAHSVPLPIMNGRAQDQVDPADGQPLNDDLNLSPPPSPQPPALPTTQYETILPDLLDSPTLSPFYQVNLSLYLPVPAISQVYPLPALTALHLSPLLLSYFPPANGVILAFANARITSSQSRILEDSAGASNSWVWLTVDFLVYRPQPGDEMAGYINAASEGFVGLVSYNYFSTPVAKERIPTAWQHAASYVPRLKRTRRGKLNDSTQDMEMDVDELDDDQDEDVDRAGDFLDENGQAVDPVQKFRIVDVDLVPGHQRDKWSLATEGTLLNEAEETALRQDEKRRFELRQMKGKARAPVMSGGIASRQSSIALSIL